MVDVTESIDRVRAKLFDVCTYVAMNIESVEHRVELERRLSEAYRVAQDELHRCANDRS